MNILGWLSLPVEEQKARMSAPEEKKLVIPTTWGELFAHVKVKNPNFLEENFPLEPLGEYRPVRVQKFHDTLTGIGRLERLGNQGLTLAGTRAMGIYLLQHPTQQSEDLVGGHLWSNSVDYLSVPTIYRQRGITTIGLSDLRREFGPRYGWLVSPRKQGV